VTFIDAALLDFTERCCRRSQRLTGKTNVWLAVQLTNLSIMLYFAWASAFLPFLGSRLRIVIVVFCIGLFYALTQTVFKVPIETAENDAFHRVARKARNPRRVRDVPLRISFLTLCALLSGPSLFLTMGFGLHVVFIGYSLIVFTTAVLYLVACDPLPPCRGTVRAWLSRSQPIPAVALAPNRGRSWRS
jgi:hypothetical protein